MENAVGSVQSILLLGGTSEIGVTTAKALVARGARTVVLAGRSLERMAKPASELEAAGASKVETVPFDARDIASHASFAHDVADRMGDVDLVLVAFGVLPDQERAEREPSVAIETLEANTMGPVSVVLELLPHLRDQGHGIVVVLSSVAGERARRSNFVYGASKAGVDTFSQGLGDALAGSGLRVMVVRPGFVKTKMTAGMDPAPLSSTPEAVATAIVRGLEKGAEMVWVPSLLRWVMVVLRHLPRAIFRKLDI